VSLDGTIIIATFLGIPLMTLAHELGHAGAALCFTKGRVGIRVGSTQGALRATVGRLSFVVSPFGAGGFCRRSQRGSRGQELTIMLAGPAMSAVCAVIFLAAAASATGEAEAVYYTLAVIGAIHLLNLIPRRAAWNPITKGLPTDGLQAWCLIRNKPIPPPKPSTGKTGLKADVSGREIVLAFIGVAVVVVVAAHHLGGVSSSFYISYMLQGYLSKSSGKCQAHQLAQRAPGGLQMARTGASVTRTTTESVKTCPQCGAEVQGRATLCYCLHQFGQASAVTS
jgi:hypothetical protein